MSNELKYQIFTTKNQFSNGKYLPAVESFDNSLIETGEDIACFLGIDCEWGSSRYVPITQQYVRRRMLSIQARGWTHTEAMFRLHPDNGIPVEHQKDLIAKHGWILGDYIEHCDFQVEMTRFPMEERLFREFIDGERVPRLLVPVSGFFMIVDLSVSCPDPLFRDDINRLIDSGDIAMKKRMTKGRKQDRKGRDIPSNPHIKTNWYISINENLFLIDLLLLDIGAIHGGLSYDAVCKNCNVDNPYKDTISKIEKSNMEEVYIADRDRFVNYANGDLLMPEILINNAESWKGLYRDILDETYYKPPVLTIGKTVSNLVSARTAIFLKVPADRYLKLSNTDRVLKNGERNDSFEGLLWDVTVKATSQDVIVMGGNKARLGKCDGGAVGCEQPLMMYCNTNNPTGIVDPDISGAYGEKMCVTRRAFGDPVYFQIESKTKTRFGVFTDREKGVQWDKFYPAFKKHLDTRPGLWCARINIPIFKDYDGGDLIPSTILPKLLQDVYDPSTGEYELDTGMVVQFTNQVINGVLEQDTLDFMFDYFPTLVPKIEVLALGFHPVGFEVAEGDFTPGNGEKWTSIVNIDNFQLIHDNESHSHNWTSVNFGDFIMRPMRNKRLEYNGKAEFKSQDAVLKIANNTIYGNEVSKFPMTSSVIFANCITAGIRVQVFRMRKCLNLFSYATDGGAGSRFDVLHRSTRSDRSGSFLSMQGMARPHLIDRVKQRNTYKGFYAPLDIEMCEEDFDDLRNLEYAGISANEDYVKCEQGRQLEHLNLIYADHINKTMPFKNPITIKIKTLGKDFVSHGSVNYRFNGETKFRGYPKDKSWGYELDEDGELIYVLDYELVTPQDALCNEIQNHPNRVKMLPPYCREKILKINTYLKSMETFKALGLRPGDNYLVVSRPPHFSRTRCKFRDYDQFISVTKQLNTLERKSGYSLEQFFINTDDGTCRDRDMYALVDKLLYEGCTNIIAAMPGYNTDLRQHKPMHPRLQMLQAAKLKLKSALKTPSVTWNEYEEIDSDED